MTLKTYSDMLSPIRVFLGAHKPDLIEIIQRPDGTVIERWMVSGNEIVLHISPAGIWDIFVPASQEANPIAKIKALERFLQGTRTDLDLLVDMGNIARTFLNRLADVPACSELDCMQPTCKETRDLRNAINIFLSRLTPQTLKAPV